MKAQHFVEATWCDKWEDLASGYTLCELNWHMGGQSSKYSVKIKLVLVRFGYKTKWELCHNLVDWYVELVIFRECRIPNDWLHVCHIGD